MLWLFFSYEGLNIHIVLDLMTGYSWKYATVAFLRSSPLFRFRILHFVIKTHKDVLRIDCTCCKGQDLILSIVLIMKEAELQAAFELKICNGSRTEVFSTALFLQRKYMKGNRKEIRSAIKTTKIVCLQIKTCTE